jgi:predicted nucleotidyltransferase
MLPNNIEQLINRLSNNSNIEAVALGGSRATHDDDALSDYDFYVYWSSPIPDADREALIGDLYSYIEIGNNFWETEDDGNLLDGTEVELIYREIDQLKSNLESTLNRYQANIGYTTCFWFNLLNSSIIYDPTNKLTELKRDYSFSYPKELKEAIIRKNLPLLLDTLPAFPRQIEKALKRGDTFSVQHRITAYFESYFDVLYAVNELPMPGEKKLISYALRHCKKLPADFQRSLNNILNHGSKHDPNILQEILEASNNLKQLTIMSKR